MKIVVLIVSLTLTLLVVSGCIMPSDVDKAVLNVNDNTNRARSELTKEHEVMSAADVRAKLQELGAQEDKRVNELESQLQAAIKAQQDTEQQTKQNAAKLIEGFGSLTPGAPLIGTVVPFVGGLIDKATTNLDKATDIKLAPITSSLAETKQAAKDTAAAMQETQKELKLKMETLETTLRGEVKNVSSSDLAQLNTIKSQLEADPNLGLKNLDTYLSQHGLSAEQIAELHKSNTPSEIVAALIAIIGGAGGGKLLERMGTSRAAPDLQKHESRLDSLENTVAKVTAVLPSAGPAGQASPFVPPGGPNMSLTVPVTLTSK